MNRRLQVFKLFAKHGLNCRIIVLLVVVSMLKNNTASAQYISIEGGYAATQYKHMQPFTKNNGGFQFGASYAKQILDSALHVKLGLFYQHYNGTGQITYYNLINQPVLSYEKSQELYYLHVPLVLRYHLFHRSKTALFMQGGLSYHLLLRAWHNPQRVNEEHNVTSQFNPHVLGFILGGGLNRNITNTIALQITYDYIGTMSRVEKNKANSGISAHSIQLGVRYRWY